MAKRWIHYWLTAVIMILAFFQISGIVELPARVVSFLPFLMIAWMAFHVSMGFMMRQEEVAPID